MRKDESWAAAQIVMEQAKMAKTEANHIRAIINSKMTAIQKIIKKAKAGLTAEQSAVLKSFVSRSITFRLD